MHRARTRATAAIEASHMVREDATINLDWFLHEIESLMFVEVAKKGLSFTVEQSPDLPRNITVDSGKRLRCMAEDLQYKEMLAVLDHI